MKNNILYRRTFRDNQNILLLVVPAVLRDEIMLNAHDDSDHLGKGKAFERMHDKYYRPNYFNNVVEFIDRCPSCQFRKDPKQQPAELLRPIRVYSAFHTVGIDYCGPFVRSSKGNRYVLVAIDHLTKCVETHAVRAATANNAAIFFAEQIVLRHGAPARLISDRETHFINSLMSHVLQLFGTKHFMTPECHPQANGLTEKVNGTLVLMKHYLAPTQRNWDQLLPYLTFCIYTAKQATSR